MPEQINVVLGQDNSVVLSFVTLWEPSFEASLAGDADPRPPRAEYSYTTSTTTPADEGALTATTNLTRSGVTHLYQSPYDLNRTDSNNRYWNLTARNYSFHFVKLPSLPEGVAVTYRVASGAVGGTLVWSEYATFMAPFGASYTRPGRSGPGATIVDAFGDMGVYNWNNMANMEKDLQRGMLDAVFHIGDHAYNLGAENDQRGDGYMQSYSRLVSRVPWVPIIGNHEYYDGDNAHRWLNQTDFVPLIDSSTAAGRARVSSGGKSTATRAIGHVLAPSVWLATTSDPLPSLPAPRGAGAGTGTGATGASAPPPLASNTSRFFSVDIGLGHFIALDGNVYINTLDKQWAEAQLAWLEADLQAVDRTKTPWVVAMSHFPLHISAEGDERLPMAWYESDEAELVGISTLPPQPILDAFELQRRQCGGSSGAGGESKGSGNTNHSVGDGDGDGDGSSSGVPDCPLTAGEVIASASESWETLFHQYGVDFFLAGHYHEYESLWPSYNGVPTQKNFTNPRATVHVTAGNGGAPGPDHFTSVVNRTLVNRTKLPASRRRLDGGNATENAYVSVSNSAGYLRLTLSNRSSATVEYVLASDSSVFDRFAVDASEHGPFPPLA